MVDAQVTRRLAANFRKMREKIKEPPWLRGKSGIEKFLYRLLSILLIFGIYLFLVWWFDFTNQPKDYLDAITIVGSLCGGIVLALNAIFLNRRAQAMDKSAEAHAKSAEAHVTENQQNLFNTAIGHLGNRSESVRLGGIYALYKLAQENHQYRKNVHEILCSHARSKTNEDEYKNKKQYKDRPSVEIQSLVDLLVKKKNDIFQGLTVNFEGVQLQGAQLQEARLQVAKLTGAQLQGAYLRGAQLQRAYLLGAQLQGAYLAGAQLQGANLWAAQLQGAYLREAQLQGACLEKAQLQGTDLEKAQLQEAILVAAQLQGAFSSQEVFTPHSPPSDFQETITRRINQNTEVNYVVFEGINKSNFDEIKKSFSLEADYWNPGEKQLLQMLLDRLEQEHLDKPDIPDEKKIQYLKDQGAETGSYDQEYADKIIAEYEQAIQHEKN